MDINIKDLGIQAYRDVWHDMQRFTEQRDDDTTDEIWVLQHPPVYTLGKNADLAHIRADNGIPVVQVDRGGQVTYHGPGQLIVYLLLDLNRLSLGVRALVTLIEESIIRLLEQHGIEARAKRDAPGVYVDEKKIASLGLRVKRGCCYHGLALNVEMDLKPYEDIDPCGYENLEVTQLADLADAYEFSRVQQQLIDIISDKIGLTAVRESNNQLTIQ